MTSLLSHVESALCNIFYQKYANVLFSSSASASSSQLTTAIQLELTETPFIISTFCKHLLDLSPEIDSSLICSSYSHASMSSSFIHASLQLTLQGSMFQLYLTLVMAFF